MKYKSIFEFFKNNYQIDLSDSKVYFIELTDRKGAYSSIEDEIYIDPSLNKLTRELTLVHELTHKMVYVLGLFILDEEAYCKEVTLEYVRQEFNEIAVTILKDTI